MHTDQPFVDSLLLRPPEVAEALGIGRSKTYELIAAGAIPSVKIGCSVHVPVHALREWVRAQATTGSEGEQ